MQIILEFVQQPIFDFADLVAAELLDEVALDDVPLAFGVAF